MNDDMATMPIPELIKGIRAQLTDSKSEVSILIILVLNVLMNRMETLYTENLDLKDQLQACKIANASV